MDVIDGSYHNIVIGKHCDPVTVGALPRQSRGFQFRTSKDELGNLIF